MPMIKTYIRLDRFAVRVSRITWFAAYVLGNLSVRYCAGLMPLHFLNAGLKAADSVKPVRSAISAIEISYLDNSSNDSSRRTVSLICR